MNIPIKRFCLCKNPESYSYSTNHNFINTRPPVVPPAQVSNPLRLFFDFQIIYPYEVYHKIHLLIAVHSVQDVLAVAH